jgi:hypothetical protein
MPSNSTSADSAGELEPAPSRGRRWAVGLTLALCSTLLCLAVLEVGIRVVLPAHNPNGHLQWIPAEGERPRLGPPGRELRQRHKAGDYDTAVRFSEIGLRESRDLGGSTSNDLFVVGDSFAFGYGVEEADRFSNKLEEALERRVYNIAVPTDVKGYGKLVRYAEQHGATIHGLVIAFCMENDLFDYELHSSQRVRRTGLPGALHRAKMWADSHLALYRYVTTLIHQSPGLRKRLAAVGIAGSYQDTVGLKIASDAVISSSVQTLKELADSRRSTILIIPSRGLWIDATSKAAQKTHTKTVAAMERAGLRVIDLRPLFEAHGDPLQYHFEHDGHWNSRGHKLAADALATHFRTESK